MNVVIVEEFPEVEPHWFLRIVGAAQFPPHFETHAKAVAFCDFMGWAHTTERFDL